MPISVIGSVEPFDLQPIDAGCAFAVGDRVAAVRHRARSSSASVSDSSTTSPCNKPPNNPSALDTLGVLNTTRRSLAGGPVDGSGSTHHFGCWSGPYVAHVGEVVGPRAEVVRGLGELHDRAVGFARHQERFLPIRIGEVDVHG